MTLLPSFLVLMYTSVRRRHFGILAHLDDKSLTEFDKVCGTFVVEFRLVKTSVVMPEASGVHDILERS